MFKIWNDSDRGFKTHIEIDGEDVSANFNSLVIKADINSAVEIELDMSIGEGGLASRPAKLIFPGKGARELLIKHGWTPPAEDVA